MMKKSILPVFLLVILGFSCFQTKKKQQEIANEPFLLKHEVRQPRISMDKPPALLLLHGFGSNEADMFSLAKSLDDRLFVIAARAPYTISEGKYKWYDLKINEGKRETNYVEAEKSRQLLLRFIDQLVAKYGLDEKQFFVGGFSQGAILSYSVGLSAPEKVKGIAGFSGYILEELKPNYAAKNKLEKLHAFVSHGRQDPVIAYSDALETQKELEKLGVKLDFKSYDAVHTISQENFTDFLAWMNGLLE